VHLRRAQVHFTSIDCASDTLRMTAPKRSQLRYKLTGVATGAQRIC